MSTEFWIFLLITTARQIPHLVLEHKNKRFGKKVSVDFTGAVVFYAFYLIIWWATMYCLWIQPIGLLQFSAGLSIMLVGITFRLLALRDLNVFYSAKIVVYNSQDLITTGAYSLVRHPLYVALLLELLGMVIISGRAIFGGIWLLFVAYVLHRNKMEDRVLRDFFGEKAIHYQANVPSMNILSSLLNRFRTRYK
jgi:protein-S-isoprenylcysteine O-methyltransferase Ste14